MHKNNMVHRDIKPENILIDSVNDLYIKLTDFGFASFYQAQEQMEEMLGSPMYMPPEIVKHQKYDSKVDVWSSGCVAYVLLSGKPPFNGKTKEQVYDRILRKDLEFKSREWKQISKDA